MFIFFYSKQCQLSMMCAEELFNSKIKKSINFVCLDGIPKNQIPKFIKFLPCIVDKSRKQIVQGNDVPNWFQVKIMELTTDLRSSPGQNGNIPRTAPATRQNVPKAMPIQDFDPSARQYASNKSDLKSVCGGANAESAFSGFSELDCSSGVCRPQVKPTERFGKTSEMEQMQNLRNADMKEFMGNEAHGGRRAGGVMPPDPRYTNHRETASYDPNKRFNMMRNERSNNSANGMGGVPVQPKELRSIETRGKGSRDIDQRMARLEEDRQEEFYYD